jgi:HAD superfamily hydrolase (TIGR01549 family)
MDAILFDWMGVLFKDPDVIGTVFPRVMREEMERSGISQEEMRSRYYPYSEGKLTREEFWRGFERRIDELESTYLEAMQLSPEYSSVRSLAGRFRLGIVSNLPGEWGEYLIRKFRFTELFDPIVVSGSVGIRKPNPEIYRIARESLGDACEVFVVDDKTSNLEAAKAHFGWRAVWMRSQLSDSDFVPDFQIDRLGELASVLSPTPPEVS